jgi:hypothetical protein
MEEFYAPSYKGQAGTPFWLLFEHDLRYFERGFYR